MKLGKKVKQPREKRGLSQNELAKKAGIRQPSVSRLEGGLARFIRADRLAKIAEVLGVSPNFLLSDRDETTLADFLGHDQALKELGDIFAACDKNGQDAILDHARYTKNKSAH